MAPTPPVPSNPAKALQQNRPRPTVARTVVPAIPLSYMQKRKQQDLTKAKQDTMPPPESITETPRALAPAHLEAPPAMADASSDASAKADEAVAVAVPSTPSTPVSEVEEELKSGAEAQEVSAHEERLEETQEKPKSAPSNDEDLNGSRNTYQMPPAFVPANNGQHNGFNAESANFPPPQSYNGHLPIHHVHPSTGSVMFGGYPESGNSSPAPPSGGNAPYPFPPPLQAAARHIPHQLNGHGHHMSNGLSPLGPPGPPGFYPRQEPFMSQGSQGYNGDNFAYRQMAPYGPLEGYGPAHAPPPGLEPRMSNVEPLKPQSIHGSQSSATNEQENGPAFYSQYPAPVVSNGSNGHIDEAQLYQQPRPKPRTGSQPMSALPNNIGGHPSGPPQLPRHVDQMDGLVMYIQQQFGDSTFADYTLELRYTDDRAPAVRIPGHNIMFARSPFLKEKMLVQAQENNGDAMSRTLLVQTNDRFLRSDGFWMAAQRLYGNPLLDLGALAALAYQAQGAAALPGSHSDRFDLGLGYAAAGHLLQLPLVIARGVEIASHFINWSNIEKALDFALDGGLSAQWINDKANTQAARPVPSTYGPAVNMLIYSALNFIITSFPAGFKLDTSAEEPPRNHRLPTINEARQPGHHPRLSTIKFGDHPTEEAAKLSSTHSTTLVLSKILLSLPFDLLKYLLESSRLGNVQGWATTALRQEVMRTVIQEREDRRLKVHDAYSSDGECNAHIKEWDTVFWKESVEFLDGNESTPTLARSWAGLSPDI